MNDNANRLDLAPEYGVNPTFDICDLSPFVETGDYEDDLDMRINPLQEGGSHGGPSKINHIRPLRRFMTRRIEKEETSKKKNLLLWIVDY